jgi:hypothetical protein
LNTKIKWLLGLAVIVAAFTIAPAAFASDHGGSANCNLSWLSACNSGNAVNSNNTTTVTKDPHANQVAAQVAVNASKTDQSNQSNGNSASSKGGNGGSVDNSANSSADTCNVIAECTSSADNSQLDVERQQVG